MKLQSIIKSVAGWLNAERKQASRRSVRRPALKLEVLEERDCPSTFGDAIQFQIDLNAQAGFRWGIDQSILQNDISQVRSAAQSPYGQVGSAVRNLQNDMKFESSIWGPSALSSNYTLQNDLQRLLGDVNSASGPYNFGSAFSGLASPSAQNWADQMFGPPIGSTPATSSYSGPGSYGVSSSYGGYGNSSGGNIDWSHFYPAGSNANWYENQALAEMQHNGGNSQASTNFDNLHWNWTANDYAKLDGTSSAGAPAQIGTAGSLSTALDHGGMWGRAQSFLYSPG